MKRLVFAMAMLAACGGDDGGNGDDGGGTCQGEVDSVSDVDSGSVVVGGIFDDGPPVMILTLGDPSIEIDCDLVNADNATCDVSQLSPGTYPMTFDIKCDDGTTAVATLGADVPDSLVVP